MKPHIYEIKIKPKEMKVILDFIDATIDDDSDVLDRTRDLAKKSIPWRDLVKSELAILRRIRCQLAPQVKRALGEE